MNLNLVSKHQLKREIEMAGDNTLTFTDDGFDKDVLASEVPVLVDFWAEWCGPCRMMGPTVDQVAVDGYAGKVKVGKLDVDSNQQSSLPLWYPRQVPTLLLFKGGCRSSSSARAPSASLEFQKMLDKHL